MSAFWAAEILLNRHYYFAIFLKPLTSRPLRYKQYISLYSKNLNYSDTSHIDLARNKNDAGLKLLHKCHRMPGFT